MPLLVDIEFETVVLSLILPAPIPSDTEEKLQIVADAIIASGLFGRAFIPPRHSILDYDAWCMFIDKTINCPGPIKNATTSYSEASDKVYESRFGMVLGSPTFYNTDSDEWKHDVRTALNAVGQRVNWKAQDHPTGLHIHVGLGKDERFTLPQLKRLACFICCFESALDTIRNPIHHTSFKENDHTGSNRYNELLRVMSIDKVYETIQEAADIDGLIRVINFVPQNNGRYYNIMAQFKVNFRTVTGHVRVVEFCHKGTLSGDTAISWTEFILRFVQFVIDATDDIIQSEGDTLADLGVYVHLPESS